MGYNSTHFVYSAIYRSYIHAVTRSIYFRIDSGAHLGKKLIEMGVVFNDPMVAWFTNNYIHYGQTGKGAWNVQVFQAHMVGCKYRNLFSCHLVPEAMKGSYTPRFRSARLIVIEEEMMFLVRFLFGFWLPSKFSKPFWLGEDAIECHSFRV